MIHWLSRPMFIMLILFHMIMLRKMIINNILMLSWKFVPQSDNNKNVRWHRRSRDTKITESEVKWLEDLCVLWFLLQTRIRCTCSALITTAVWVWRTSGAWRCWSRFCWSSSRSVRWDRCPAGTITWWRWPAPGTSTPGAAESTVSAVTWPPALPVTWPRALPVWWH